MAVGWIGTREPAPHARTDAAPPTTIEIVAVERPPAPATALAPTVAPIDVVLAVPDDPPLPQRPVARPSSPPRAPGPRTPDAPAMSVAGAGAVQETAPPSPAAPSPLMAMRRRELPRLALPSGRWDDLDHVPRGTAPEKDLATGKLHESGGGKRESEQGVFVARVSPDGSVKLTDRPNFHIHLALPSPRTLGRALARWYESDKGPQGADGDPALAKHIQVTSGSTTDPGDRSKTVIVPILSGGFDVTDWLMRSYSGDPYASKKLAFLDSTRDERVQIGGKHRSAQLARSTQLIRKTLDALWASPADLAARKRALFELWDDCAEAGDPDLVAGGQAARGLVIGFIRAHLPKDGADAYTPDELTALSRARQSKAPFQPYE